MKKFFVVFLACFLFLLGIVAIQYVTFQDGKLHVVFCDVGQGDGIFIRTPGSKNIVVDGGPNSSILSCVAANTPFWERRIDIMFLTHPHEDHFIGLIDLLSSYKVSIFVTEELENPTQNFLYLEEQIRKQNIPSKFLWQGDTFRLQDGVTIKVLSPTREFVARTSPGGKIGERNEFASLILIVLYGENKIMLTGDSQAEAVMDASKISGRVQVLQAPHHGSRTGLSREIIDILQPSIAVISVGKNSYGHPSSETLSLLKNVKVFRTDQSGNIHFNSDGKQISVSKSKF